MYSSSGQLSEHCSANCSTISFYFLSLDQFPSSPNTVWVPMVCLMGISLRKVWKAALSCLKRLADLYGWFRLGNNVRRFVWTWYLIFKWLFNFTMGCMGAPKLSTDQSIDRSIDRVDYVEKQWRLPIRMTANLTFVDVEFACIIIWFGKLRQ